MNNFNLHTPTRILFGKGAIAGLREQIPHDARVLITYGGGSVVESGAVEDVFFHPKTEFARRLVLPEPLQNMPQERLYRLIFNGRSSYEPVIANMVLECGCPVNIMYADTRDLNGVAYGQMVLQLPERKESIERIMAYARARSIMLEEMSHV